MSFLKRHKIIIPILGIISLAFFLRVWQVNQIPPSLNWDEVSHGYNAYSILQTGKDEWGVSFPKIFRAYGDYKLPVYIYLTAVSEAIFGLNELAVKLPSVLAGTLSVFFVFLLARKLFDHEGVAIFAALLMAVEPWGLFLSRVAVEANLASLLLIAGVYFFLLGLQKKKFFPLSALLFGLSLYTYNSARIFVPLFLGSLILFHLSNFKEWIKQRQISVLFACLIFFLFLIPMLGEFIAGEGQARYRWVALLDEGTISRINEARRVSSLPNPIPRLIHNKLIYSVSVFNKNYLSYFSPNFIFFEGGSNYQFNIPGVGLIYPIQLPFILLGLWVLLKRQNVASKVILVWFLLAPIPGSLTKDSPHALRAITMLPIPQIITALGVWSGWQLLNFKNYLLRFFLVVLYFLILILFLVRFWDTYTTSYRKDYSWSWQYGYKEMVQFLKDNYSKYDKIIITKKHGEPHEFVLFWWPWDPQKFQDDPNLARYFRTDWYWVDRFDKFEFVNDWEIEDSAKCPPAGLSADKAGEAGKVQNAKCLLVTNPGNYPKDWQKIKTINFLDNKPAFEILENIGVKK